jgi:hypothetical protein
MIGTSGPSTAPSEVAVLQGKLLSVAGADAFGGRHRLEGFPTLARCRRKGGTATGPSPVDRGRPGSKHHLLVDQSGLPLAFALTGSNRNDVTQLIPLLDAVPAMGGLVGRVGCVNSVPPRMG